MNQDEHFLKMMHIEPYSIQETRAPLPEDQGGDMPHGSIEAEVIGGSVILSREDFCNLVAANHGLATTALSMKQEVARLSRLRWAGWILAAGIAGAWAGDLLARWML